MGVRTLFFLGPPSAPRMVFFFFFSYSINRVNMGKLFSSTSRQLVELASQIQMGAQVSFFPGSCSSIFSPKDKQGFSFFSRLPVQVTGIARIFSPFLVQFSGMSLPLFVLTSETSTQLLPDATGNKEGEKLL